jgi:starch-binding outer membrane protein, SusD/RagB family
MKKFIFIVVLLTLTISMGCDEEFLDVKSKNALAEDNYYQTEQHAIETITSCYDPMKHPAIFSINMHFLFTTWGDRAVHENAKYELFSINADDDMVFHMHARLYKGVYRCNTALQKIPDIEMDNELKQRLIAEAKYLRGFYYFYLRFLFRAPILITEPETDINRKFTNGDPDEIFAQIETDLTEAAAVLPESYGPSDLGRATKGAALALLGKAYMYNQQFDKAKEKFLEVKNSGVYSLMTPQGNDSTDYVYAYLCNFSVQDFETANGTYDSENNQESVFEVQFHHGGWEMWEGGWQADGHLMSLYYGPKDYKNLVPTVEYVEQFEFLEGEHPAGLQYDPRRYATIYERGDTIIFTGDKPAEKWNPILHSNLSVNTGYGWKKYFYPAHYGPDVSHNDPNNLRIIRYADVLLMLAEAEFHLNGSTQLVLDCINEVRNRAGVPELTEVTKEDIIHERDVELGFEWSRFFDLVRWSKLPDPWFTNLEELMPGFQTGKNEYLPIPQYEIDLNRPALEQNPGWEN